MSDVEKQLMKEKKRLIKNLKIRKDFEESNVFYICPEGCVRMDFKQASDSAFMCPDCGEDMVHQDNLPFIHIIQERIKNLESR